MIIGTVVRSNSHISYLCRVYGKLETDDVPEPQHYAFGTFVTLVPVEGSFVSLVGVVRDTLLINPEYGNLGPRLSSEEDLAVFSPDYLNEKGVLVEVLILGWIEGLTKHQTVPGLAAQVGARVETMPGHEVAQFHRDENGGFVMGYMPQLMMQNDPMAASLLLTILDGLEPDFPAQARVIGVLKNNLAWKARVAPTA